MKPDTQLTQFDRDEYTTWWAEWKGMPEYSNVTAPPPLITVTFKFKSQEDYDLFHSLAKKHLYKGKKVFDGMQRKDNKSAWFPLKDKASRYRYE